MRVSVHVVPGMAGHSHDWYPKDWDVTRIKPTLVVVSTGGGEWLNLPPSYYFVSIIPDLAHLRRTGWEPFTPRQIPGSVEDWIDGVSIAAKLGMLEDYKSEFYDLYAADVIAGMEVHDAGSISKMRGELGDNLADFVEETMKYE